MKARAGAFGPSARILIARGVFLAALACSSLFAAGPARADGVVVDRVAARCTVPETGGPTKPRFVTERELRFWARVEATIDEGTAPPDFYARYARTALDRFVAEDMLASLLVERGAEPSDLPKSAVEAREELEARVTGPAKLAELMKADGISEAELGAFMRRRVRATVYVDRAISPILKPAEDEVFQGFRTMPSPFRTLAYEEARGRFVRFYVHERFRSLSLDFVKSARARLTLTVLGA